MTLHVDPAAAGLEPTDEIQIDGRHRLHVRVEPGCRALLSTAAMIVNGLPQAMAAPPGVHRPWRPAAGGPVVRRAATGVGPAARLTRPPDARP